MNNTIKLVENPTHLMNWESKNYNHLVDDLVDCFPAMKSGIIAKYQSDQNFREVVHDYLYCRQKLERLSHHPPINRRLMIHFENTMKELEEELMSYLI